MRLTFVVGVAAALLSLVVAGCSKSVGDAPSPRGKIPIRTAAPRPAPSSAPSPAPSSAPATPLASVEPVEAKAAVAKPVEAKPAPAATAVVTPVANDKPEAEAEPAAAKAGTKPAADAKAVAEAKPAAPKGGAKPAVNAKAAADAQPKADATPAVAGAKGGGSPSPAVWSLLLQKGAEATLDQSASGGFVVTTSNLPEGPRWMVQVIGPPTEIEAHRTYQIRFRARAATPRQVYARLCESQSPWGSAGFEKDLDLSREWQDFSFEFEAEKSVEKAQTRFYLGNDAARVEFEDIAVEPRP